MTASGEPSAPYYADQAVTLWHGDALAVTAAMPDASVDCVITSPPYFGLRDYGDPGQWGLEESPAAYVEHLRDLFRELARVLAPDGTAWLNIGDSYSGKANAGPSFDRHRGRGHAAGAVAAQVNTTAFAPYKSLIGIPWRVAFALQDDGWIIRNAIVWAKPNANPESIDDRLSARHELLFLLVRSRRYWFDLDAIRETPKPDPRQRPDYEPGRYRNRGGRTDDLGSLSGGAWHPNGRNPGDVWTIPVGRFPEAHFATMPPALAERCVLAGCRRGGGRVGPVLRRRHHRAGRDPPRPPLHRHRHQRRLPRPLPAHPPRPDHSPRIGGARLMLTVTDLFCGAGGSSTGAIQVPGVRVRMAANHWQLAVDTHNTNHPDADHDCADVSQVDPRRYPRTDILWASPECTNHSQAKGRKRTTQQPDLFDQTLPDEAAERSRATMWDVVRFTEHHRYAAVVVENVVDAYHWPPFRAWLLAMDAYGYDHQLVFLNSMHAQAMGLPAPQSRDRMYVVFHLRGNRRPDVARFQRPKAWCPTCDAVVAAVQWWKRPDKATGRYRQQYLYRCPNTRCRNAIVEPGWLPAAAAIDWSLPGTRIGDRAKPLAEKTRLRIAAGIARYWTPIHLEAAGHTYDAADPKHRAHGDPNGYYRAWPVDEPLKTMHADMSKALAVPVEGRDGKQATPVTAALRTQTTRLETALVQPFIAELRGGGSVARPTSEPLATVTAGGNHHGLVVPLRTHGKASPTTHPTKTVVAGTVSQALVTPYYGHSTAKPTSEALPTVTTVDRHALVMRNNTARGDQGQMTTPAHEVMRTLTTTGHQSLLTPGDMAAAEAQVDDVLFRMLEPAEVIAAMAFPDAYIVLGNRREQVRMAGNAVTPPAARDLIAAVVESLTGEAVAAT